MQISLKENIAKPFNKLFNDNLLKDKTYIILTGGRNSLKSSTASIWDTYDMIKNPNTHSLWIRKVANTLKTSVHNQNIWALNTLKIDKYFYYSEKMATDIEYLPTKQLKLFRGADEPGKIKSIKLPKGIIKRVFFEEFDQFDSERDLKTIINSILRGTEEGNFKFILIMNPPQDTNHWSNKFVRKMSTRKDVLHIHTDYRDMPVKFVSKEFIKEAEYTKENDYKTYEWEYLGIPNGTGEGDSFIDYDLFAYIKNDIDFKYLHTEEAHIGADIARFGNDKTEIYARVGNDCTVYHKETSKESTMETVGRIIETISYLQEKYKITKIKIKIDDTGLGGGVTDRLMELKNELPMFKMCEIYPINNGESIKHNELEGKKQLKDLLNNVGTEMWYKLGKLLQQNKQAVKDGGKSTIAIPIDTEMFEEASSRKKKYTSNGKLGLESKDDYKKRIGKSPDKTDALALCFYEPYVQQVWVV